MNCKIYEWLRLYTKGGNIVNSMYSLFKNDLPCYCQVRKVKPKGYYINNVTCYTISGITKVLFIMVLEGYCGGNTYTIGINRGLKVVHNYMETREIQLNHKNLSHHVHLIFYL